ncbi:MAG: PorV/PorQ family protein [Elusimicrobia bacterium]|nr:PorV/PorQ family protein [Elusimicrobiota bacterium]
MAFAAGASGAVFPDGPFSDKAAGATGAAFLKLPAGARIPSFGGSYAAAADNAEAMFWNPAGLSRLEGAGRPEAAVGYLSLLETMYSGSLAYAHPLANQRGVVGASFLYFSQSPMQGYDPRGDPTSRFTPNDLAHSVGYGTLLGPVRLGGAVKFIRSAIDDACGSTFALDFGIQADRVTDIGGGPLDLGLSVQNFGPPIKLGSMSDPLPFKMAIGGLWRIVEVKRTKLSGLVDAHMPVDADPYFSLGAEFIQSFDEGFSVQVRSGYNMRNARGLDELAGVAAGLGMDLRRVRLDYAWVPFGELGTTHRVALGYRF